MRGDLEESYDLCSLVRGVSFKIVMISVRWCIRSPLEDGYDLCWLACWSLLEDSYDLYWLVCGLS